MRFLLLVASPYCAAHCMPLYLIKPALVQAPVILAVLYVEEVSDAAGVAADKEAAGPGKEKENGDKAGAAGHELIKPVPGRSRFGSRSEANPLAALNPGCAPLFTHYIPYPCHIAKGL